MHSSFYFLQPSSVIQLTSFCQHLINIRCCIALFETHFDCNRQHDLLALTGNQAEYTASDKDPEPFNEPDSNLVILKVKFEDLKKQLPKLDRSVEGEILWEVSLSLLFVRAWRVANGFFDLYGDRSSNFIKSWGSLERRLVTLRNDVGVVNHTV